MQIQRILFPVDFSDSCIGAARYVAFFAGKFDAEVTLLHAVATGENNFAAELLPGMQARLDGFLESELKYFTTHRVCVAGDPASAIAECAASVWRVTSLRLSCVASAAASKMACSWSLSSASESINASSSCTTPEIRDS